MKRLISPLLIIALLVAPGCLFSRKAKKVKENPAIAADTDQNFRQRFLDRRVAELMAVGQGADTARRQAEEEFQARYGYTSAAQK